MSKREIIEFIEANPFMCPNDIAKTLSIGRSTARAYRAVVLGSDRTNEAIRALQLRFALSEIDRCGCDIVEYLSGEMNFNIDRDILVSECAEYFCIPAYAVNHVIDCYCDEREVKRWRDALKRKLRNQRFVK